VILLSRGRHGATLTPVGARVLTHARSILQSLDELGKEANLAKGLQGGAVRIAAFRSVATHVLPSVIAAFRERFPAIGITLIEFPGCVALEQDLRDGRADVGITLLPTSDEFRSWEILRDEYLVLIPPNYQIKQEPLTWEDLATYPLILSPAGDSCRELFLHHLTSLGKSLKPTYEVREDSTIVSMIRQGLGVGIIPRLAAEPIPIGIQKRSLPNPLERVIGVAILADALQSPAVYAFLDTLKEMSQMGKLVAA
jgi:DNA-binding transcriptional LysR family regulator